MATFKILAKDDTYSWVLIEITFDDGTKRQKRMMVDLTDIATARQQIKDWYLQYMRDRQLFPTPVVDARIQQSITGGASVNLQ